MWKNSKSALAKTGSTPVDKIDKIILLKIYDDVFQYKFSRWCLQSAYIKHFRVFIEKNASHVSLRWYHT